MRRFLSDFVGFGPVTDQSRESSQQDQVFSYLPRRHAACDMLINKNDSSLRMSRKFSDLIMFHGT